MTARHCLKRGLILTWLVMLAPLHCRAKPLKGVPVP
jgi:hypothetical protein